MVAASLALGLMRTCSKVSIPPKPPAPTMTGTTQDMLKTASASADSWRTRIERDATTLGVATPSDTEMSRKFVYRLDEEKRVIAPGEGSIEAAGLRLTASSMPEDGTPRQAMVLTIENLTDQDLAYHVVTTPRPVPCPLCDTPDAPRFHEERDRRYFRCATCALVFLDPAQHPAHEQEAARYRRHRNDASDAGYVRFLRQLIDPLLAVLPAGALGLDYGWNTIAHTFPALLSALPRLLVVGLALQLVATRFAGGRLGEYTFNRGAAITQRVLTETARIRATGGTVQSQLELANQIDNLEVRDRVRGEIAQGAQIDQAAFAADTERFSQNARAEIERNPSGWTSRISSTELEHLQRAGVMPELRGEAANRLENGLAGLDSTGASQARLSERSWQIRTWRRLVWMLRRTTLTSARR